MSIYTAEHKYWAVSESGTKTANIMPFPEHPTTHFTPSPLKILHELIYQVQLIHIKKDSTKVMG
jgi:hypothetical protein